MRTEPYTKEVIRALLERNDLALAKAILALYALQTEAEKSEGHTKVHNGAGFNAHDAPFLTSIAKALPKWNNHMTPRQIAKARPMMLKYSGQLARIAEEKRIAALEVNPEAAFIPPVAQAPASVYGRF